MNKIKSFVKKHSLKTLAAIALCVIAGSCLFLTGCGKDNSGTYTVEVITEGGMSLEKVGVYVYTDETKEDIVAAGKTDESGKISFESEDAIGCVIMLENVSSGYQVKTSYEIKEKDTQIVLEAELLDADDLTDVTFELGGVFADMSVTAADGNIYTVSELLKEKKAVVINFWYLNCAPCKMEFPYLQEAYDAYKDDIEVIAVNPLDGTNETIRDFQTDLGLTFPMAVCDAQWEKAMGITAYPTTVVIDRYGTIALIHKGYVTETETFTKVFEYFTAEDYKQTTVKYIEDLN